MFGFKVIRWALLFIFKLGMISVKCGKIFHMNASHFLPILSGVVGQYKEETEA
jgi:hypothetical protein